MSLKFFLLPSLKLSTSLLKNLLAEHAVNMAKLEFKLANVEIIRESLAD